MTSALDGGEWSASRTGRTLPREKDPDTHWTGVLVDPEPVWTQRLDEKSFAPAGDRPPPHPPSPSRPVRSQTLYWLSYRVSSFTVSKLSSISPTEYIYRYYMILSINSDYFFVNLEALSFLWSRNLIFKNYLE
jgi:hypothetical protein